MVDKSNLEIVLDLPPERMGAAEHFGNIMKDSIFGWAAFFPRPMDIGDVFYYNGSGVPSRLFNAIEGQPGFYRENERELWLPLLNETGYISTIGLQDDPPILQKKEVKTETSFGAGITLNAFSVAEGGIKFSLKKGRTAALEGSPLFRTSRHEGVHIEDWLKNNVQQIVLVAQEHFRLDMSTIRLVRGTTKVRYWKTFFVENLDRNIEVTLKASAADVGGGVEGQDEQRHKFTWTHERAEVDENILDEAIFYQTAAVRVRKRSRWDKMRGRDPEKGEDSTKAICKRTTSYSQNAKSPSGSSASSQQTPLFVSSSRGRQDGLKDNLGHPVDWLLEWLLKEVPDAEMSYATDQDWILLQGRTDEGRAVSSAADLSTRLHGCITLQLGVSVQQNKSIAYLSWTDAAPPHLCELKWRVHQSDTPARESTLFLEYVRVWLEEKEETSFEALQTCNLVEMLRLIDSIMAADQEKPPSAVRIFCTLLRVVIHFFAGDWILAAQCADKLMQDGAMEKQPDCQLIFIAILKYREQARLRSLVYSPQGAALQVMDVPPSFREATMDANAAAIPYADTLPIQLCSLQMQVATFSRNEQSKQYFGSTPQWEGDALQQSISLYSDDPPATLSLLLLHAQRILYSVQDRKELPIMMKAIRRLQSSETLDKVAKNCREYFKAQSQATFFLLSADALVTTWAPPETWGLIIWERLDSDFYERQFETVLADNATGLAQARRSSILQSTATQRKKARDWYKKGLAISNLPVRLKAAFHLRLGFLEMLQTCSASPALDLAACSRAYHHVSEAAYLYQTTGYHADYVTALTHKTLLKILLGVDDAISDIETCAFEVGRWGKRAGGYTYAVCLGHFCSAIGRQWLGLCGDARVAYQCHFLAAQIFFHLEARVAEAVSLTVLAYIVFYFGQIVDIHSDAAEGRPLAFRALSIWERVWMGKRGPRGSKGFDLYTALAQRTASILYDHLVDFVPASKNDAEAFLRDMSKFEALANWLKEFGPDGQLKAWTSVPPGYAGRDCVPPHLYNWAISVKSQAEFMGFHIVARFLKRNGEEEMFQKCSSETARIADALEVTNPIVYSLLKSSIHLMREELDKAAYHYANFYKELEKWQAEISDTSRRKWALSHSGDDAMYWFYRANQPVQAKERWDALLSLYPNYTEALETAEGNWRSLAVLAFAGERNLARERYNRAMDLYAIERANQRRLELRTAFASDPDAARLHFRAARINFDVNYALLPDGSLEAAFSCIEKGKAREVMARLQEKEVDLEQSAADALEKLIINFRGSPVRLETLRKSFEIQRGTEQGLRDTLTQHYSPSNPPQVGQVLQEIATLQEIKEALPPNTVVLYYAFFEKMFYAWAIPGDSSRQVEFKGRTLQAYVVSRRANAFFNDLSHPPFSNDGGLHEGVDERYLNEEREERMKRDGAWLADLLLSPFANLLKEEVHLVVVPHGELHRLPFEALPWKKSYLGTSADKITISYVPCASLLLHILQKRRSTSGKQGKLLVLGVGVGTNVNNVKEEVDAIHEGNANSVCLVDAEATEEAILRRLNDDHFDSLHFSGDGKFDTYSPPNSRLLLQGNETLTLFALQRSARGVLRSVSLDACHAGKSSQTFGGDDIQGFAHYFLGTGATQTVAPMWHAEGTAASMMVKGLYKLEAANLREARKKVKKNQKDPYFWAAFVVFGYPLERES